MTPTFRSALASASGALTSAQVAAAISPLLSPRTVEGWRCGHGQPPAWAHAWILERVAKAAKKPRAKM